MGQAKQRKAEIAALKATKPNKYQFMLDMVKREQAKGNQVEPLVYFVLAASAKGWDDGYECPDDSIIDDFKVVAQRLAKAHGWIQALKRDINKNSKFDYIGGIADLAGGTLMMLGL